MRVFGLVCGSILLLGCLALAVLLIPPHLQIRQIEPPLPEREALLEAIAVPGGPVALGFVNTSSQGLPTGRTMGHPAFVLEWPDGRRFLIDSGMERDAALAFGEPLEWLMGAETAQAHGSVGEQLGPESGQVAGIAFTHLHSDHAGGVASLCARRGGELALFQTPLQAEERNHTTDMGYDLLLEAGCGRLERFEAGPVYGAADFPGLVAVAAGGHTPGSTIYFARVADRLWVFSGDITNSREELEEDLPKQTLYSLLIVPEHPERLSLLRQWLREWDAGPDTTVVVSHDLEALTESGLPSWR
ncbi:MAG: MBL fold metallo-hydrolase [Myxococcota bacterium]|nr:MBL fold metallo-hydrolase [Myxococcota bacterium]